MSPRTEVLWIEDSGRYEFADLLGPVYYCRKYTVTLAEDATSAWDYIIHSVFDIIIVDIRLPPGYHQAFLKLYQREGKDKDRAQLGLRLLRWMLNSTKPHELFELGTPPAWINSNRIAIFSVESRDSILPDLNMLGVHFKHKTTSSTDTALLDLIQEVEQNNHHK